MRMAVLTHGGKIIGWFQGVQTLAHDADLRPEPQRLPGLVHRQDRKAPGSGQGQAGAIAGGEAQPIGGGPEQARLVGLVGVEVHRRKPQRLESGPDVTLGHPGVGEFGDDLGKIHRADHGVPDDGLPALCPGLNPPAGPGARKRSRRRYSRRDSAWCSERSSRARDRSAGT